MDFAEFYISAKDDCLRAVLASTGDVQAAEDVVAEAFARAWASWRTVSRHPSPRAWVVRTALNVRVSRWRRHRREVLFDHANGQHFRPGEDGDGEIDEDLMAALLRLPTRQRQVVALRTLLGLDTAETASVLRISPGRVAAHMARALAALRQELMTARERERQ
jgi:RNA polymerase sigma factor (sigma-70 family)